MMPTTLSSPSEDACAEALSAAPRFLALFYPLPSDIEAERLRQAVAAALRRRSACQGPSEGRKAEGNLLSLTVSDFSEASIEAAILPWIGPVAGGDAPAMRDLVLLLEAGGGGQGLVVCQHGGQGDAALLSRLAAEVAALYSDPATDVGGDAAGSGLDAIAGNAASEATPIAPPDTEGMRDFWRGQMAGLEDVARFHRSLAPAAPQPRRLRRSLSANRLAALDQTPGKLGLLPLLAAAFAAQIFRQTGQADVIFTVEERLGQPEHAFEPDRGAAAALPIRLRLSESRSLFEIAEEVEMTLGAARRHAAIGGAAIRELTGLRPDFGILLQPKSPSLRFGESLSDPPRLLSGGGDEAIRLCWQHGSDGAAEVQVDFDAAVIEAARAEAFLARHLAILTQLPHLGAAPLSALLSASRIAPPSQPAAQAGVNAPFQAPGQNAPLRRLFDYFQTVAQREGAAPALRFAGQSLSYAALLELVEDRAAQLQEGGVRPGMRVGVLAERGPDFVISLLALSRLGASFAALDTGYPAARILELADRLEGDWILGSPSHALLLEELRAAGEAVLVLEADPGPRRPRAADPSPPAPGDLAYYLFTSGTTGGPKLIGVGHGALPQFLSWQAAEFGLRHGESVAMLSGLAHDPVLRDIFLPLLHGGLLTIPTPEALRQPKLLLDWLEAERPELVHTTPAMGQLLTDLSAGRPQFPGTRIVFWGGDMLPGVLLEQVARTHPGLEQVNFYGATETPQAALYHRYDPRETGMKTCPVGRPAAALRAEVIGPEGQLLDVNEIGELRIHSPYLVRIGKAGEIAAGTSGPGQIYDTGDLAYLRPDGAIQLIGRRDDQVSIRGYRVELSDVERQLLQAGGLSAACVLSECDAQDRVHIIAHVVALPGEATSPAALRRRAQERLPSYMVPTAFLLHESLPLLPNGKRNRAALRAHQKAAFAAPPAASVPIAETGSAPADRPGPGELWVRRIITETTGLRIEDGGQSFAEIGADSLNYIKVMMRLEPMIPTLPPDWQNRPIAELGALVDAHRAQPQAGSDGAPKAPHPLRIVRAELPILMRTGAILAIMALHLKVGSLGGGGTFLLFLLTGQSIFRFQLPRILAGAPARKLLAPLLPVVIATVLVCGFLWGAKILQGEPFHPAAFLFLTNLLDFTDSTASAGGIIWLWFIACYVQILLVLAAALSWPRLLRALTERPFATLLTCFAAAVTAQFGVILLLAPELYRSGVPLHTPWAHMLTTHLPTVLLGGLVHLARARVETHPALRHVCLGVGLLYFFAVGQIFSANQLGAMSVLLVLLLYVDTLPLPWLLYRFAALVSAQSLYVYLLHNPLYSALRMAGMEAPPLVFYLVILTMILGGAGLLERLARSEAGRGMIGALRRRMRQAAMARSS